MAVRNPPLTVAVAVAVFPLGGAETVTAGPKVYPEPPLMTVMAVTSPLATVVVAAAKRLSSRFVEFAFMLSCAWAALYDNRPAREAWRKKRKEVTAERRKSTGGKRQARNFDKKGNKAGR